MSYVKKLPPHPQKNKQKKKTCDKLSIRKFMDSRKNYISMHILRYL